MSIATLRLSPLPGEEGGGEGGARCLPFCIIHVGVLGAQGLGPDSLCAWCGAGGPGPPNGSDLECRRSRALRFGMDAVSRWGEGMRRAVPLHVQQQLRDDRPLERDMSRGPGFGCQVCP